MKVIDTSVLVAALLDEVGAEKAQASMQDGCMSIVNAAEALHVLIRKGVQQQTAYDVVDKAGLTFHSPNYEDAYSAALINQTPGLSLGDSFCLALAKSLQSTVVTADRLWASLNLDVSVELIR
jgi:ribonuclease VapC